MKKKILFVLGLVVFTAVAVSAQSELRFSIGGGGYFSGDFGGGVKAGLSGNQAEELNLAYYGKGIYTFFDATYLLVNFGLFDANGDWTGNGILNFNSHFYGIGADMGIYVKFPFFLGKTISLFPLLGINYRALAFAKFNENELEKPGDLNSLWFKFGGGIDIFLTDMIFLRADTLYGIRLPNKFERDLAETLENMGASIKTLQGHGLDIKLAIGFRL